MSTAVDVTTDAMLGAGFELGLFAAVVFLVFGIDDLIVDILWLCGVGRQSRPMPVKGPIRFAVAIPAWDEGPVIDQMLASTCSRWAGQECCIYVGVYPNDQATIAAVTSAGSADDRIRVVINAAAGPTTKGACLNTIWRAIDADRRSGAYAADAVLIHDAEDVVDGDELRVLGSALATCDYAQLPVMPMGCRDARWIGGHYCDEFAEAHGKELPVRSALGGPLPTAGVGCAFRIEALAAIAEGEGPFHADCLTEDYELGIRLTAAGRRGHFIRVVRTDGTLVASRAYFPHHIGASVRQKTRWLRGIALDGWDRLGWSGVGAGQPLSRRVIAGWMLWRDRRSLLAAIAILAGYVAMVSILSAALIGAPTPAVGDAVVWLFTANLALLVWRLGMRAAFTARLYGPAEGVMAVLRQPISNIILVMTAWRAIRDHLRGRAGSPLVWDKTLHRFPVL